MKLLAETSVNLDHRDRSDSLVALHMVAGYVRPDVAKVFLDLSADPGVRKGDAGANLDHRDQSSVAHGSRVRQVQRGENSLRSWCGSRGKWRCRRF